MQQFQQFHELKQQFEEPTNQHQMTSRCTYMLYDVI